MFNPSRLILARTRRGLTKASLAAELDVTARAVATWESGQVEPYESNILALVEALRFPREFFSAPDIDLPKPTAASFRSLTSMSAAQRRSAVGAGAIAIELARWLNARFELPLPNVPDLREVEPESAASTVRMQWGLGEQPVRNMIHLLEANGVLVFSLAEECREVDAFSWRRGSLPFVFLNRMKTAEHGRFDAAHELGHLVLHQHGCPQGQEGEKEANRFASAFLMPKASVLARAPAMASVEDLIRLKKGWGVSVAALAYRLRSLGMLSEWHYRTLCIDISQRGYRTTEPEAMPHETSQVLQKIFSALREEGVGKADVARALHLPVSEIDALIFGFVIAQVGGGGAPNRAKIATAPAQLKLIK